VRVALVHDWLTGMRGGERVLDVFAAIYPDADLYTLFHVPGATSERIEALRIHTSALDRLPGARRHYRALLPLYPTAIESFHLAGYDLVISTHHAVAKGVRVAPGTPHLCYCFTPMRYVWDQIDAYLGRGLRRAAAAPLVAYLRHFDLRTSTPARVTRFAAISRHVADRVWRHYGRQASVVHPPVALERFRPSGGPPDDFYLLVAGFVPYKREAIAVEAFARLGRRLVVVGDGPGRTALAARSPAHVEYRGRVDDAALAELYARCRALVYTAEEDFGLVPLEAQAAGRPVIAYRSGGVLETLVGWGESAGAAPTGIWYEHQTGAALADAVRRFEAVEAHFDPRAIRAHASRFDESRFRLGIAAEVEATRLDAQTSHGSLGSAS
jgi:glycosyltransferase involved in cell wall biosynthesis